MASAQKGLYERIVDTFNAIYGAHEGQRAVHAKGTLCAGTFTATPDARRLTTAPHMQGEPVRAHIRFSNASGDPNKPDGSRDGRGMGVKLYLDDGATTDIVAVTVPVFVARTPEDFLEITTTRIPDPATGKPDPKKIESYLADHPEAMGSIFAAMSAQPPASYLQLTYHAVHAFQFVNADGERSWIRYRWDPEAGEAFLDPAEARARDLHYLYTDLERRFSAGGGAFRLSAQIAAGDDDVADPTTAWPDDRERVELGRLEVTAFASDREHDGDVLVFDPTRVTAGIELSEDPILNARPHAYAESVLRRSGVRRS